MKKMLAAIAALMMIGAAQAQDACRSATIAAQDYREQAQARSDERAQMRVSLDAAQNALAAAQKELADMKAKHKPEAQSKPAKAPE
jgi:hypothetical protein